MENNRAETIQGLLDDVRDRTEHYLSSNKGAGFNVFETLEVEDKEVIMCRMLAGLLNPHGRHGQGPVFLKIFCRTALSALDSIDPFDDNELNDSQVNVTTEYLLPGSDRRIDIVIRTPFRFIPIEVKIYAGDQKNQVRDYCAYTEGIMTRWQNRRMWGLFYLTLDGHAPSEYSTGDHFIYNDHLFCISWKDQITDFLGESLKLPLPPQIGEVVRQYRTAVDDISGSTNDWRMNIMADVLMSKKNIETADMIADSIQGVKTHMLGKVFTAVETTLAAKQYSHVKPEIVPDPDFDEHIKRFYKSSNNDAIGINLLLKKIRHDMDGTDYYVGIRFDITWRPAVGAVLLKFENGNKVYRYDAKEETPELFEEACSLMNIQEDGSAENVYLHWHYVPGTGHDERHNEAPNFDKGARDEKYYELFEQDGFERFANAAADAVMEYYDNADWDALEPAAE